MYLAASLGSHIQSKYHKTPILNNTKGWPTVALLHRLQNMGQGGRGEGGKKKSTKQCYSQLSTKRQYIRFNISEVMMMKWTWIGYHNAMLGHPGDTLFHLSVMSLGGGYSLTCAEEHTS